jgi:hypothetical protein
MLIRRRGQLVRTTDGTGEHEPSLAHRRARGSAVMRYDFGARGFRLGVGSHFEPTITAREGAHQIMNDIDAIATNRR